MEVWSANDEDFNYCSLDELLNDFPELKVGDVVYKAEAESPNILSMVSGDDIFELIQERAYDYGGEWAEDWCYYLDKEQEAELNKLLIGWAEGLPAVNFYQVGKSEEYKLTETDLEIY